MKRKITLTIIMILSLEIGFIILTNKEIKIEKDKEKENNSSFISMMFENEKGEYQENKSLKFPTKKYIFNPDKSGCENGGILSWNAEMQKIQASLISSDRCYAYFDHKDTLTILREDDENNILSANVVGGMYRYQGVGLSAMADATHKLVDNNYVCFGTNDKNACLANVEKYLYRIMGITNDGSLKLIKTYALNQRYAWNDDSTILVNWPESKIFSILNGPEYLQNSPYVSEAWENKIIATDWPYGLLGFGDGKDGYYGVDANGEQIYQVEQGTLATYYINDSSERVIYKWNPDQDIINAKIGLMYVSDYYLAYDNVTNFRGRGQASNFMNWLYITNNDLLNPESTYPIEWTMNLYGYAPEANVWGGWLINADYEGNTGGYVSGNDYSAKMLLRPTFYLTPDMRIKDGDGKISNPYILI